MGLAFDRNEDNLFASEGSSGRVRQLKLPVGRVLRTYNLNQNGFSESYTGDLAFDEQRQLLYVIDQANFRLVIVDARRKRIAASIGVGRLPFAIALSPNGHRVYVTNLGMFEYLRIPGTVQAKPRDTWLRFPAFGFPSPEAESGAQRETDLGVLKVPGLGDPNVQASNSVCVIDVSDPEKPRIESFVRTGLPVGGEVHGGSSPSGVLATEDRIFVSNGNNDSITIINAVTLKVADQILLRIPRLEQYRGVRPAGLALHEPTGWLLVAEAGINAVGVIDTNTSKVIGHIPAGWFPVRVALQDDNVYVTNAQGFGTGPNAGLYGPLPRTFQADMRRGAISLYPLPGAEDLPKLTERVMASNGFLGASAQPTALPAAIRHVVVIVKGNRSYDEVLGDIAIASNGPVNGSAALARFGRAGTAVVDRKSLQPRLSRRGVNITPNHHAMASRWAFSDNFHADSETSADGHHWLTGSYPTAWTQRSRMRIYNEEAVLPEEVPEAGGLWHHLERNRISFRNFGMGLQLPGIHEGPGLQPAGARYSMNMPIPQPLFRNTSRGYPPANMNIPDQFRASQFIKEAEERYRSGKEHFPGLVYVHLPNDRIIQPNPENGYPFGASYIADNDYALGRIVEYLSNSPWWREMAILVTESSAQGGVDHVDAHRTVLLAISPYAKRNYASHVNSSFPGLLKTVFRLLRIPPLHLFDATAADLSDCFTNESDFTPYRALLPDSELFNPEPARDSFDRERSLPTNDR